MKELSLPPSTESISVHASLQERYQGFPDISFDEFKYLTPELKKLVLLRHPLVFTDTYNRTMEFLAGAERGKDVVFTLQLRKGVHGYHIISGINELVRKISQIRLTADMVEFASDYFSQVNGVRHFDKDRWMEIATSNDGKLPIRIDALPEGSIAFPGEPIVRVRGDAEMIAHFEPLFHRIFFATAVATNACAITQIISPDRFIEVGLRGSVDDETHLIAGEAMYVGGGIYMTSDDALPALHPQYQAVGTLGHRYVQSFDTEEEAFRHAIEKLDSVSLLVDLNDSYSGIDLAIRLKQEYRDTGKRIWIRLDSGDVAAQTIYTLQKLSELGMTDTKLDKVIVEGIETIAEIVAIEKLIAENGFNKENVMYGAGGLLLAKGTTRADVSSGFKLAYFDGAPSMKFSDSPTKASIPGIPTIQTDGDIRLTCQQEERFGEDLLLPHLANGEIFNSSDLELAHTRAMLEFQKWGHLINEKLHFSPLTQQIINFLARGGEKQ